MKILSKLSAQQTIRIFTKPYVYTFHLNLTENIAPVIHSCFGPCDRCKADKRSYKRFQAGAILRKDDRHIILDFGPNLYNAIRKLYKDPEWKDPFFYDLNIDIENGTISPVKISYVRNSKDSDILRKDLNKIFSKPKTFDGSLVPGEFIEENISDGFYKQFDIYEVAHYM